MAKNVAEGQGVSTGVIEVPLSEIVADEKFNARKSYDGEDTQTKDSRQTIAQLAETLKRDGLQQPLLARKMEKGGKYSLVFGFRRFYALKELAEKKQGAHGLRPGYARLQLWEGNDRDAMLVNLTENTSRNDLLAWEIADRAKFLKDEFKMTGSEIGQRISKSKSYVDHLIGIVENVHPTILEAWRKGKDGRATTMKLIELKKLEHKEQLAKWNEEAATEEEKGEAEGEKDGPAKIRKPSTAKLKAAMKAVKDNREKSQDWRDGARSALRFALGIARTIPGVYNPDAKPKKEDDADDDE